MVQTDFRAEFRARGSREKWRPYYGTVRLPRDNGAIANPITVSESVENIRDERYEWRFIGRETTWHEWTVIPEPPKCAEAGR